MDLEKLGTFIHNKREEAGITLVKVAQKAGIGRSTLWILERGKNPKTGKASRPSRDILEQVAEVLRMSQAEWEEVLALAGYDFTRQLLQTDPVQQTTLSLPVTITEINGTVYYARDRYLEAFDAKTGSRLWYSSLGIPPPETTKNSILERVEQVDSSSLSHAADPKELIQKTKTANAQNVIRLVDNISKSSASDILIDEIDRIIEDLRGRITSGEFGRRGRLPTLRKLAIEYQITSESVNKVLQALQAEGWIDKGMFVNISRIRMLGLPKNSVDNIIEIGLQPIEKYIEEPKVFVAPKEIAESMKITPKELVVKRFLTLGAPNAIYRILNSYFPKELVDDEMFKKMANPSYDALPDIKIKSGKYIKHTQEDVFARFPTQYEQDLLRIVRTNPVIDIKRVNMTEDRKTVVMYNHVILNANHFLLSYNYSVNLWD